MSYVPFLGLFFAGWKEDNEKTMKIIMKKIMKIIMKKISKIIMKKIMKIIMKKIMKIIMLKSSSCLLGGKIRSPRLR